MFDWIIIGLMVLWGLGVVWMFCMPEVTELFDAEVQAAKEATINQLRSMLFSLDQNGMLTVLRSDKNTLISAIELLSMKEPKRDLK